MILRDASRGSSRFDQFHKGLGIAPNILSARLAMLVDRGLLEKRQYSERPPRDEYVLTPSGRDFIPILQAIASWGRAHLDDVGPARLLDAATGLPIDAVVIDRTSGRELSEMQTRLG